MYLVGTFVTLGEDGVLNPVQSPSDEPLMRLQSIPGMDVEDVGLILETFRTTTDRMTAEGSRTFWLWNALSTDINWATGGCLGKEYLECGSQAGKLFGALSGKKFKASWKFRPSNLDDDGTAHWATHVWIMADSDNPANPTLVLDPWYNQVQIKFKHSESNKERTITNHFSP